MTRLTLAASAVAILVSLPNSSDAREQIKNGFHQFGGTRWTAEADLVEVAHFPLDSTRPTFRIMLEYLERDECSEAERGDGCGFNVCVVYVELHPRAIPTQTNDIWGDEDPAPDLFLISQTPRKPEDSTLPANREAHLQAPWPPTPRFVVARNNEGMVIHTHLVQAAGKRLQCMVALTAEYHKNYKALFTSH